jgi:nucleotide-binding universal stress UspA family protein
MMISLLALVDGSGYSRSVCDHAAWFARRLDAAVEIVHVLGRRDASSKPEDFSGNIGLGARTALLQELAELDAQKARLSQKRGRAILDDARDSISASGVSQVTTKLRMGEIVEMLQDLEADIDMIVIGKRGGGADFNRPHLGSNLERVVRSSHKPVLVASRAFKPVRRFLVAYDGGPSVIKAIDEIAHNKVFADLDCELLRVGTETAELAAQMETSARQLREAGYQVQTKFEPGRPETVIAREVESDAYDLLVMGAFGHSRIRHLIIGSTTTEMIRSCKIPILLFR